MRFFPHVHLPLWIRGRVLPTLDEREHDRDGLKKALEEGLREEQFRQASNEAQAKARKPG